MKELVGAETPSVARAYAATCAVFGVLDLRTQIDALDNQIDVGIQTEMYLRLRNFLRRQTIWFLRRGHTSSESLERIVTRYKGPVGELACALKDLATPFIQDLVEKAEADCVTKGAPQAIAHELSLLEPLLAACDIVDLAIDGDVPVLVAGRAHSVIGEAIGFERLLEAAVRLTSQDHWERLANRRIIEDLMHQQAVLTGAALKKFAPAGMHAAEAWVEAHGSDIKRISAAFDELEAAGPLTAARLSLALGHVRDLVTRAQAERRS
jgi:glutamate dehydrogenase